MQATVTDCGMQHAMPTSLSPALPVLQPPCPYTHVYPPASGSRLFGSAEVSTTPGSAAGALCASRPCGPPRWIRGRHSRPAEGQHTAGHISRTRCGTHSHKHSARHCMSRQSLRSGCRMIAECMGPFQACAATKATMPPTQAVLELDHQPG
jgi:hypothetical protein